VLDACERDGMAFLPFYPLANGLLTGKYRIGEPPPEGTRIAGLPAERAAEALSAETLSKVEALTALAEGEGHSILELAFAWLLSRAPVASVIAGATTPEQVAANASAGAWVLTPAEVAEVDALLARVG